MVRVRCVAALTVTLFSLIGCGAAGGGALKDTGEPFGVCRSSGPTEPDTWETIRSEPTVIGLDYLVVSGDKPVRIESVQLFGGNGRLRLVSAAFAPGGGIGLFGLPREFTGRTPLGYRNRVGVPGAVLTQRTPAGSVAKDSPKPNTWQVVVSVLPLADYATADGVRIMFRVGDRFGTLTGKDYLGLARDESGVRPTPGGHTTARRPGREQPVGRPLGRGAGRAGRGAAYPRAAVTA